MRDLCRTDQFLMDDDLHYGWRCFSCSGVVRLGFDTLKEAEWAADQHKLAVVARDIEERTDPMGLTAENARLRAEVKELKRLLDIALNLAEGLAALNDGNVDAVRERMSQALKG